MTLAAQGPCRPWAIIAHNGSIANILSIPNGIKAIWGISQKKVIDLAADSGASEFEHSLVVAYHRLTDEYALLWLEEGLKTGMYYLRTHAAAHAVQFTINQNVLKAAKVQQGKSEGVATGIPTPSTSPSPSHQVPPPSNSNDNGVAPSSSGPSEATRR
ncbi:hypothetical protein BD769DRAFT_1731732 [Suillus cothurnatus]|jgi:ribonucleoside-diphosphate reductase subunit M1|nr:hypothetical protein BD769DRAFT_1731732 [Suillus cothurnatus]